MYIVEKKMYVHERDEFVTLDIAFFDTSDSAKIACLILNAFNYDTDVIYEVRLMEDNL